MHYKSLLYFLSIFYIWNLHNFAQSTIDSKFNLASDEFSTCDYSRFESILEALNEMIQLRLNKQSEILQRFEKQFDSIGMLSDIKKIMNGHDVLFKTFGEKLKNVENILNEASLETNKLGDSISKNLPLLKNIEMKLTNVDTITIEQNRNIREYLNKTEATKICLETDDQILVCTSQSYSTSCADFNANYCANNKCRIHNHLYATKPFWVACDGHTEGGGWTVIQRRLNGSVDFYRNWSEYKDGFGSIDGEFFIGLDKLHALTTTLQPMELFIQLRDFNDIATYAKYDEFVIANETENYVLSKVGKYSGDATDAFSQHQGFKFTTRDRDNDIDDEYNCAKSCQGAWWYRRCFFSNLNGKYYDNHEMAKSKYGICWKDCNHTLKYVQMMIRPKNKNKLKM